MVFRRGVWRHHLFWHHRRWYRAFWVRRVFLRPAVFVAIPGPRVTVVVGTAAFIRINPWYQTVLYEGDEGYVLMSAPVGYETDTLPDGAETITVDGQTYFYVEWSFYQEKDAGGYVVVDAPDGAEVSAIPDEAILHDEGELPLYQFDNTYFSKDTNDAGKTVYRVEPSPPEEELEQIPTGSPSFVAGGETYYYVNYSLYVEFEENGQTGFVNGEPDIGAPVDELPTGAVEIDDNLYQFDMVFFEQVEDENGTPFYEVVDNPDGDEVIELDEN
jgi:hypothetical protein